MSRTQYHAGRKQKMDGRGEREKGRKEKEKGSRATRRTAGENGGVVQRKRKHSYRTSCAAGGGKCLTEGSKQYARHKCDWCSRENPRCSSHWAALE